MGSKDTTFQLNAEELRLIRDPSFFSLKQRISGKIIVRLESLRSQFAKMAEAGNADRPLAFFDSPGKISRGENYRGLPWLVLDYPAVFEKDSIMAFRTLFWWGNFFSFTFHLSGQFFMKHGRQLIANLPRLDEKTLVCINTSQWEHHHDTSNYISIDSYLKSNPKPYAFFEMQGFIKLSVEVPFSESEDLETTGKKFLAGILESI